MALFHDDAQRVRFEAFDQMERLRQGMASGELGAEHAATELAQAAQRIARSRDKQEPLDFARQLLGSAAAGAGSGFLSAAETGIEARVTLRMTHVPTALAHVLDPMTHPLVSFSLENAAPRTARLRLITYVEGYSARAVDTLEIKKGKTIEKNQFPTFFPEPIRLISEPVKATVHVEVHDLDAPGTEHRVEDHRSFRVWLLPTSTAVLWQQDPSGGQFTDLTRYLVGWVTPNCNEVMGVLREAAGFTLAKRIVGYQCPAEGIEEQVGAFFNALHTAGLFYVNSISAIGAQDVFVQRVRLPREALAQRSANCIDGAVLYASLIEAASLQAGLVIVPGHAFVAWRKQKNKEWDFLETTLTGSGNFEGAVATGRQLYDKFNATGEATILDVAALRREGYLAMA